MNLEKAIKIAVDAHSGQFDKGNNPYILHPLRVMLSLNNEEEQIVGILHDVIEDCDGWTYERLQSEGFSENILNALKSVSKTLEEEVEFKSASEENKMNYYLHFISCAQQNKIGKKVKIADLKDNLDISRINDITEQDNARIKRYQKALELLEMKYTIKKIAMYGTSYTGQFDTYEDASAAAQQLVSNSFDEVFVEVVPADQKWSKKLVN